jgi:hypothetical protein
MLNEHTSPQKVCAAEVFNSIFRLGCSFQADESEPIAILGTRNDWNSYFYTRMGQLVTYLTDTIALTHCIWRRESQYSAS